MYANLDDEIARLEKLLDEVRKAKSNSRMDTIAQSPDGQLAIFLHDKFCRLNHTDGCAWHYDFVKGVHNWNGYEHRRYLQEAKDLRAFINALPRTR